MDCYCSFLDSQLGAAFIGVLGTLFGAGLAYLFAIYQKEKEQTEQLKNYVNAIVAEITSLRDRYHEQIGQHIESNNDNALLNTRMIRPFNNYFVVFDNNIEVLGLVRKDLVSDLVKAYLAMKGTFEIVVEQGERLEKNRDEALYLYNIKYNHKKISKLINKLIEDLTAYSRELSK